MEHIVTHPDRTYYFTRISAPEELGVPPGAGVAYGCLLWDSEGGWSIEERGAVVERLIEVGCRTIACGGHDCELWHHLADETVAFLNATSRHGREEFVMTTWHTGETPHEVAFYVTSAAQVEEPSLSEYLVLEIGGASSCTEELISAVRRYSSPASSDAAV